MARALEVGRVFVRLGCLGFGGPAAHIALMEEELVVRREWLSREAFLDLLGAVHLLPGPNSTELALALSRRRGGWAGLLLGGAGFILPAVILSLVAARLYAARGESPVIAGAIRWMQPAALVIVAEALVRLGRTALRGAAAWLAAGVAAVLALAGLHELVVLAAAAVVPLLARLARRPLAASVAPWPLFLLFLKTGAVLYGSGYVLLAFLRGDLVLRAHWLTDAQLVDAIAIGQATPGPVFSAATFAGYLAGGTAGALAATAGIFLPAFLYAAAAEPIAVRLRRLPAARAALDGVVAGSLGLMAVVVPTLARGLGSGTVALAIAAVVLVLRLLWRVNPAWLVAGAAAAGAAAGAAGIAGAA
jgi:chromate transporter